MKMNRRNALLGLGAIATGGGLLFGSGAFSQVQADRNVTVDVNGDQNALANLTANNTDVTSNAGGNAGNQLAIDGGQFNPNATTRFDDAFDVAHQAGGDRYLAIGSVDQTNYTLTCYADASINDIANDVTDLGAEYVTIQSGATLTVGIDAVIDDVAAGSLSQGTLSIELVSDPADLTITSTDSGEVESS